ncbi:heme ABC transporter ATP-binding protein [Sphingobacterium sp. Mn56C]|uniref:heme ABC transporter ATP-binding protein n=1 Tax=Sphingobacterium sp. Mn56C TaxID=3395261 RepID=UPI003BE7D40A
MLRIEKITYEVKGRKLLRDVSFQVRKGEILALLGANGAGKSTLMSLLCGEKKPTSGAITLKGKPLEEYDLRELSKSRAMLCQQQQMTLAFTVKEIVLMGRYPHYKASPTANDYAIVAEVMEVCGVHTFQDRNILSLSGGEQQRVQLARVLAQIWDNPDSLLLLDEPISALDLYYQQKVMAIAKALARKGFMVVLVIHDVNFAATYADRILMLKNGRKLFDGTPIEVLNTRDLYAVFTVETAVEINAKTLRPYVRLEEMPMDITSAQHSYAASEIEHSLLQRYKSLKHNLPHLKIHDIALALEISEAETWLLDTEKLVTPMAIDFERLFPFLPLLGTVRVRTKNKSCIHTKYGIFPEVKGHENVHLFLGDRIDLRFFTKQWHVAFLVEEKTERSILIFDKFGQEIHAIELLMQGSDFEVFEQLKKEFGSVEKGTFSFAKEEAKTPRAPTFDSETQQKVFQQDWEALHDTHAFQALINSYNLSRIQALHAADIRRAQKCDLFAFKDILRNCVNQKLPIMIFVYNSGAIQIHTGVIENIIDQGHKYIIKDEDFTFELSAECISSVWVVSKPTTDGDVHSIELFDRDNNLVVQLFGKRKPGEPELQQWEALVRPKLTLI